MVGFCHGGNMQASRRHRHYHRHSLSPPSPPSSSPASASSPYMLSRVGAQSFGGFKAVGSKFSRMTIIALMTSFCKEESFKIVLRIRSVGALQLLIDN